jgi:hypothetical protein
MEEKYWFSFIKLMIKIENIIEIVNFLSTLSKNVHLYTIINKNQLLYKSSFLHD